MKMRWMIPAPCAALTGSAAPGQETPPPLRLMLNICVAFVAIVCAGCSSFHYAPSYREPISVPAPAPTGLAVATGQDIRPPEAKRPDWALPAENIVARALASEVKHYNLFRRVKIHADDANPAKYPLIVDFRVRQFGCVPQPTLLQSTGRAFLQAQGLHGFFAASSIPVKYSVNVDVEFSLRDAVTQRILFTRSYSSGGEITLNGHQNARPKMERVSAALEEVVTRFTRDLASR